MTETRTYPGSYGSFNTTVPDRIMQALDRLGTASVRELAREMGDEPQYNVRNHLAALMREGHVMRCGLGSPSRFRRPEPVFTTGSVVMWRWRGEFGRITRWKLRAGVLTARVQPLGGGPRYLISYDRIKQEFIQVNHESLAPQDEEESRNEHIPETAASL